MRMDGLTLMMVSVCVKCCDSRFNGFCVEMAPIAESSTKYFTLWGPLSREVGGPKFNPLTPTVANEYSYHTYPQISALAQDK